MSQGSRQLVTDLLQGNWRRRQQVREEVTRKLTTSRRSYEELVPVEFGLYVAKLGRQTANLSCLTQEIVKDISGRDPSVTATAIIIKNAIV